MVKIVKNTLIEADDKSFFRGFQLLREKISYLCNQKF